MTKLFINILSSCVLTLSQVFPTMLKPREISDHFIWLPAAKTSAETSDEMFENVEENQQT